MKGFVLIELSELIKEIGEDDALKILSDFSCPLNKDVEYFLREKAVIMGKMGSVRTHLVFSSYKDDVVLVGYFAIMQKIIFVAKGAVGSNLRGKLRMFTRYNEERKGYELPLILIAQLGKNFSPECGAAITGDELLEIACQEVGKAQMIIGGKFVFLECEETQKLQQFYADNGFVSFGKRKKEKEEQDRITAEYLLQMLKYIRQ